MQRGRHGKLFRRSQRRRRGSNGRTEISVSRPADELRHRQPELHPRQRRETGGLSVAQNNSAARNIPARNRPAVGNRAAVRNTCSRRAAPP